jgi:hypothetical protein
MRRKKIDHDKFKKTFDTLEDKKDSTENVQKSGEVDYLSMLIISKDSDWKTVFDIIMLFASVYSTFSQAYYAAFGPPDVVYFEMAQQSITVIKFIDETVELLFYLDFIFCFLQEYKDVKGSCVFDLLACLPLDRILGSQKEDTRLYRLLKLFRVPRLLELLNVDRIKQTINDHYNKILQTAVENNVESKSYPILKALMLVQIYKIFRLIIIIFTSSYFLGILWHILVCDIQKTDWIDPNDHSAGAHSDNYATLKL